MQSIMTGGIDIRERVKKHDDFWCGKADKPLTFMWVDLPGKKGTFDLAGWQDVEAHTNQIIYNLRHTAFPGDTLPMAFPNIGPDFFAAGAGCNLTFCGNTSFAEACLTVLTAEIPQFDFANRYVVVMEKLYESLLAACGDEFLVMLPDFHTGADFLSTMRGAGELCLDLYDKPDVVRHALAAVNIEYSKIYGYYMNKLVTAGLPCSSWTGLASSEPYGIVSCDFAYMISPEQFVDIFMPALTVECNMCRRNIFHVDGNGVLNHLDAILTLPGVQIIQWAYGAGNGSAKDHIAVYRKCLDAGKLVQVFAHKSDLEPLFASLPPEGLNIVVGGIDSLEEADYWLKRIDSWK